MSRKDKTTVAVAVATMNLGADARLEEEMRLRDPYLIINQITKPDLSIADSKRVIAYNERGLSRSRNRALENIKADVMVVADDDMYYEDFYQDTIRRAYLRHADADIIAFHVDNEDASATKKRMKEGRLNRYQTMKISSWQITFRVSSVRANKLSFDENFGTGTDKYMGEENIFLFDACRSGMVVYYVPEKIATLRKDTESTWFEGYSDKYFRVRGATFARMQKWSTLLFIFQFAVRKYRLYKKDITFMHALRCMLRGARGE